MPWTTVFCIIGSLSISAFPLFSGFISKSMILTAVAIEHHTVVFLILLMASAGVMDHSGIKIPFFAFFAHDSGKRCEEAPRHMLWAMGITAFLCIAIGVYPQSLYAILPYPVDYAPYTTTHVLTQLQLLLFSALYRVGAAKIITPVSAAVAAGTASLFGGLHSTWQYAVTSIERVLGPKAWMSFKF